MVVSNRKSAVSGDPHTLSPTPRSSVGVRTLNNNSLKHQAVPEEYVEAIKLLSENTMNQACELLLLEDDDASASAKKLLETCHKCQEAYSVVKKKSYPTSAPSLTGSSSMGAVAANNAIAPRSSLSKKVLIANSKHGVVPMRGRKALPQHQRRDRSDSADKSDVPAAKKARVNVDNDSKPAPSESPPQNALNFLAKLNKGDSPATTSKRKQTRTSNRKGSAKSEKL